LPARSYLAGCTLVVLAGLTLSLGIICLRGASSSNAWQYLFWRALAFCAALALVATLRQGASPIGQIRRLGGFAWVSVGAMVASQIFFVAAIKAGNTAEVFFLMSLAPLMAAVLARPLLGERLGLLSALAIAIALGGVALMSGLNGQTDGLPSALPEDAWLARGLALGTAVAFALYSLATRGSRPEDLDAALLAVGVVTTALSAGILLWLGLPLASSPPDAALALLHGGIILAAGLVLFAQGSRRVPGVTLVMLAQAETIAAPVWAYLLFDETTTTAVVIGGTLIVLAVLMQASDGARQQASAAAAAARAAPRP